jgi:mannose-6-phosphate isomerase-like protein (cupin superfamily)
MRIGRPGKRLRRRNSLSTEFSYQYIETTMSEPVQAAIENHYTWGEVCDGWHLLRDPDLSVIEERMPPGAQEKRHFHGRSRQFFYVLTGELTMEVAGRHHLLTAGHGLEISPGEPHQALNRAEREVRFLVISHPPSHEDRVLAAQAYPPSVS